MSSTGLPAPCEVCNVRALWLVQTVDNVETLDGQPAAVCNLHLIGTLDHEAQTTGWHPPRFFVIGL